MSDKALKLNAAVDEIEKIRHEIANDGFVLLAENIAKTSKELRRLVHACAHAYGESTRGMK